MLGNNQDTEEKQNIGVKNIITCINFLGDSLSDRQGARHREIFNMPIMGILSGVAKCPKGRFSDEFVWVDYLAKMIWQEECAKKGTTNEYLDLNDDDEVAIPGTTNFMRTYCQGGLTAADHSGLDGFNIKNEITEEILTTLAAQRNELLKDDRAMCITAKQKQTTLIVEWSGANDLVTITKNPNFADVEQAVTARIENIKKLIEAGYCNFALLNLPNFAITPRYQNGAAAERAVAAQVSIHFNNRLAVEISKITEEYPDCNIDIFNIYAVINSAITKPEEYGLDPNKLTIPLTESNGFDYAHVPAKHDYAFWDDVHPTSIVHKVLASEFHKWFSRTYQFEFSQKSLLQQFKEVYGKSYQDDLDNSCCYWLVGKPKFDFYQAEPYQAEPTIEQIIAHAKEGGKRTMAAALKLNWLNRNKEVILRNPAVKLSSCSRLYH